MDKKLKKDENMREIKPNIDGKYMLNEFKNIANSGLFTKVSSQIRDKYIHLTNKFNNNLNLFYQDNISDEGLNMLTQYLYYSFYLEKERLKKFGIHKSINFKDLVYKDDDKNNTNPSVIFLKNGVNKLFMVFSGNNHYFHNYFYKNHKILRLKEKNQKNYYYLDSLIASDGKYVCPNCGNEANIGDIFCECSFCGTKISVNKLNSKLSSIYTNKLLEADRGGSSSYLIMVSFFCIIFGFYFRSLRIFLWILGVVFYIIGEKRGREKGLASSHIIENMLKEKDEHFSSELFLGNLDSKVKMLLYCDNCYDLNCLYKIPGIDLSELIEPFQNIIKADMTKYILFKYKTNDIYDFLEVEISYDIYCLNEKADKIDKFNKTFNLTLKRKTGVKSNVLDDAIIYTCQNCGDSFDFLTGKCNSCDNDLVLENYDWIICNFSKEKSKLIESKEIK